MRGSYHFHTTKQAAIMKNVMIELWWVWLWMASSLLLISSSQACPSDCVCKWKGGKQSVECLNKTLRTFPPTIDIGTQVLDMSGNSFETLPPDHFIRAGLINLQKIYLSRCKLSHINSRAFRGLSNLVDLDLGKNLLRDVPSFPDTPGLMRLILSGNPIQQLPRKAFFQLNSLTALEMSGVGLEFVENGAFEGLFSLEWLKLEGNRLKKLGGLEVLPLGLKGVSLQDNPWLCDCHLLSLRMWLVERNVANDVEPRCNAPLRMINHTIRHQPMEQFACFPQLSPTTMFQKIGEGKNVSLLCKVVSVPESSLEWVLNGQPLSNSSLNVFIETSSPYFVGPLGPIEKKSELLILNATSDENGTFLCSATNAAGTATANFTLRVITRIDEDHVAQEGGFLLLDVSNLIANYPNLFLILLSTFSVIILLLGLLPIVLLICKCGRACRRRKQGGPSTLPTDTSTISAAKSNVFLLSSPMMDGGDSNPDIIEEATKRVEGDGSNAPQMMQNYDHHYYQIPPPPPHPHSHYSVPGIDLAKYPKQYYHPYELPPGQGYVYGVFPELRCGCIPEGDETEGGVGVVALGIGGHGSPDEGYHGEVEGTEI